MSCGAVFFCQKPGEEIRLSLRYCVAVSKPVVTWLWLSPRMGLEDLHLIGFGDAL